MLRECVYEIQPAAAVAFLTHSSFLHIYSIKEKGQLNIRYRTSFSTNVMLVQVALTLHGFTLHGSHFTRGL